MSDTFSEKLFKNPTAKYRGVPFWGWNGTIETDVLREQLDIFRQMGFGGVHIHPRIGLSKQFLGKEYLDGIRFCVEYGEKIQLKIWLYDEDKWPSGFGGGMVADCEDYRARYLLFTNCFISDGHLDRHRPAKGRLTENGEARLLAAYRIKLENDYLVSYAQCRKESAEWFAYEVVSDALPWFNNSYYIDVLNPDAVNNFVRVVYERFRDGLGTDIFSKIPAIFTDEPQFTRIQPLEENGQSLEASIAYTQGMEELYINRYGSSLFEHLPEIFFMKADGSLSKHKYQYFNLIAQRFADTYPAILGKWCNENGIQLTGHLMYEDSLVHQSQCIGEAMRSYPYFDIPGIDMLADFLEYNTAKQVQSVARQENKPAVASELYGATNWDHDFRGHKLKGDWQAALGVTVRIPHIAWMYMGGESKRDYPAPIDAHSPWYTQYPVIENHFARLNTILSKGCAAVNVAVLHPIESFWQLYGPRKQIAQAQAEMDKRFSDLTEHLLFNLIDFDFLSEALLPTQHTATENGILEVGVMKYRTVIIPPLLTIRRSTLELLYRFQNVNGRIILLGKLPKYVDGKHSKETDFLVKQLETRSIQLGFDMDAMIEALKPDRDLDIIDENGLRTEELIYQLRDYENERWLFVAHGKPEIHIERSAFLQDHERVLTFCIKGYYDVEYYNTLTGIHNRLSSEYLDGFTQIRRVCYKEDSFLLRLLPPSNTVCKTEEERVATRKTMYLPSQVDYFLEEPNVCLLDQAEWRLDNGAWMPTEEILKIDDQIRRECGIRLRIDSFAQPWVVKGQTDKYHCVELLFRVNSHIDCENIMLAFEADTNVTLIWNNQDIAWSSDTYYLDRMIHCVKLGNIKKGENTLQMRIPFGSETNLEWAYLLGVFGVAVKGRFAEIIKYPKTVCFGDYARQGFAFYGGNLIYTVKIDVPSGFLELEVPNFAAPLIGVSLNGGAEQPLFMDPYRIKLGYVEAGIQNLKIRCYGSRINQFGQIHNCNAAEHYFGPKTWRTTEKKWCYEYHLHDVGILTAPILRIY